MSACNANTLPWQPRVVCPLLLFARYETYIFTNIRIRFPYLYVGITRRDCSRKMIACPFACFNEKIRPLPMKRTMISRGNYSPDPRATFSGNSRIQPGGNTLNGFDEFSEKIKYVQLCRTKRYKEI